MKLYRWKEMPLGGIVAEPGSTHEYRTGGWRTYKPLLEAERCSNCLTCWILCPDSAVLVEDGKVVGFDYEHCKGCGICAKECPAKCQAIRMVLDTEHASGAAE